MASHRRGPWSQAEDAYLVQLVHTQGALNWVRIAQLIGSRSPKQCRERYHQNLKPSLNHEPISPEEGLQIERMVGEMGKRWAEIARRLHGRSDNAVKNWWNGSMNRRRRQVVRRTGSSRDSNEHVDERFESQHTFAMPAPVSSYHRGLTINSELPNHHQHMERSLPSPSTSEVSMDGAPSLVSDTGSLFSISPRGAPSPGLDLPRLNNMGSFARRLSHPTLQFGHNAYSTESEYHDHPYSARHKSDSKHAIPRALQSPTFHRPAEHPYSSRPQQYPSLPSASMHLPPLQSRLIPQRQPEQRDSRMNLSSLLG